MVVVEPIGTPVTVGEGPHWDAAHQVLYYVDIPTASVIKYDPATNTQTSVKVDGPRVTLVVPVEGKRDQFLISVDCSLAVMTWDGKSPKPAKVEVLCSVHEGDHGDQAKNFNDGKVDPTGRFWAGTIGKFDGMKAVKSTGCLFSFSKDWKPTAQLTDVLLANGLAWSPDSKTMYHADSLAYVIRAFDFNPETGDIANARVLFDFKKNNLGDCSPDGMTVDSEGNLWVACFDGGQVIRVDTSSGKVLTTVKIPSPQTTSVAFGGRDLDELYVTSAKIRLSEEVLRKYPLAGSVFRVTGLGVKGVPARNVQL